MGEAQGLRASSQASEGQVRHYFPDPGRHAERPATTFIEVAGLLLVRGAARYRFRSGSSGCSPVTSPLEGNKGETIAPRSDPTTPPMAVPLNAASLLESASEVTEFGLSWVVAP